MRRGGSRACNLTIIPRSLGHCGEGEWSELPAPRASLNAAVMVGCMCSRAGNTIRRVTSPGFLRKNQLFNRLYCSQLTFFIFFSLYIILFGGITAVQSFNELHGGSMLFSSGVFEYTQEEEQQFCLLPRSS